MKQIITTGHFNLITPGHIHLLRTMKRMADEVVIFLDDDESNDLKKYSKSIFTYSERYDILNSLEYVDWVQKYSSNKDIFEFILGACGKTYECCFAKGTDYNLDTMCQEQRQWFEKRSIPIMFIPLLEGYSTTKLIKEIVKRNNG